MVNDKTKPRIFYGWWIVLASAISHALSGGFYLYGFSTFFMPLVQEFGWSRVAVSGAFSLSRMEGGILGPVGGFLIDKFGPRKIMILGVIMLGTGFILFSRIDSLITFYLVFILLIAVGITLGTHQACAVAVANWFIRKRGIAISAGMSGVGLGGIIVPMLAWLITQYGWRPTAVITGIILWSIGIPLALVMRHRPEQYGYLPDGDSKEESVTGRETGVAETERSSLTTPAKESVITGGIDFTPRQALRTPAFWLLTLISGLRHLVVSAVVVHQIPFLIGLGISPELAGTMLGSIALISTVGRFGFGWISDMVDKKYVMAICLGLIALGCLILANVQSWWHVIPFIIIYSPGYGGGGTLVHVIRAEYFGRQHFGTIMGLMDLAQVFGVILGPVFAGRVFDVTGSYRLAFITFAVVSAIAMMLILMIRRPAPAPVVTPR